MSCHCRDKSHPSQSQRENQSFADYPPTDDYDGDGGDDDGYDDDGYDDTDYIWPDLDDDDVYQSHLLETAETMVVHAPSREQTVAKRARSDARLVRFRSRL